MEVYVVMATIGSTGRKIRLLAILSSPVKALEYLRNPVWQTYDNTFGLTLFIVKKEIDGPVFLGSTVTEDELSAPQTNVVFSASFKCNANSFLSFSNPHNPKNRSWRERFLDETFRKEAERVNA